MQTILTKYSRQYPNPSASSSQSQLNQDWQHYVNPVIKLTLNKTKDATGRVTCAELTVVWSMNPGVDSMDVDNQQIVFENLNLLSFSSTYQANNPPLKAVYRDAVVGIRYQHPAQLGPGVTPTFRRFQVIFDSSYSATAFISAIEDVCPCKYNAPTANPAARTMTMAPPMNHLTGTSIMTHRTTANMPKPKPPVSKQATSAKLPTPRSSSPSFLSSLSSAPISSDPSPVPFTSFDPFRVPATTSQSSQQNAAYQRDDIMNEPPSSDASIVLPAPLRHAHTASRSALGKQPTPQSSLPTASVMPSSLPPSSQQTTSSMAALNEPPASSAGSASSSSFAPPRREFSQANVEPFLQALKETTRLHDLSTAELEALVASVIWEDGFEKLVQKLDKMWAIQGLLRSM